MKKYIVLILITLVSITSCGLIKKNVMIDYIVQEKERLDQTENPALQFIIKRELGKKRIRLSDVVVKEVRQSTNIDYDFCVIVDVSTKKGMVECYIYSDNIKRISKLKKGTSRIDVSGEFGRFFTLLDEYYTKVEIVKASIKIRNPEGK